jgi:hypothetical protein
MLTNLANIATIVGTGVAIIAVIIAVWLGLRNRQRRALSYAFETLQPLSIDSGSSVKDDIRIFYGEKLIESLYIIRVGIKNTGGAASSIKRADLIDPIKFVFVPGTKILREPRVIKSTPINIKADISLESSENDENLDIANLTFDLLNASWEIVIEFVYSGRLAPPSVIGKINEIPVIDRYNFNGSSKYRIYIFIAGCLFFGVLLNLIWNNIFPTFSKQEMIFTSILVALTLATIFMLYSSELKSHK